MEANGLKSPNDLHLEAKNENRSRYGSYIYNITLSYNIKRYFVFWLLRDDNAVFISLIIKKTYIELLWRLTYVILPPKCIEFPQHSMVKIFLRNDSYVTTSM